MEQSKITRDIIIFILLVAVLLPILYIIDNTLHLGWANQTIMQEWFWRIVLLFFAFFVVVFFAFRSMQRQIGELRSKISKMRSNNKNAPDTDPSKEPPQKDGTT